MLIFQELDSYISLSRSFFGSFRAIEFLHLILPAKIHGKRPKIEKQLSNDLFQSKRKILAPKADLNMFFGFICWLDST